MIVVVSAVEQSGPVVYDPHACARPFSDLFPVQVISEQCVGSQCSAVGCNQQRVSANPQFLIYPPSSQLAPLINMFVFYVCESVAVL